MPRDSGGTKMRYSYVLTWVNAQMVGEKRESTKKTAWSRFYPMTSEPPGTRFTGK